MLYRRFPRSSFQLDVENRVTVEVNGDVPDPDQGTVESPRVGVKP
jgi:hypothetical protein